MVNGHNNSFSSPLLQNEEGASGRQKSAMSIMPSQLRRPPETRTRDQLTKLGKISDVLTRRRIKGKPVTIALLVAITLLMPVQVLFMGMPGVNVRRPSFVYQQPYSTSTYYRYTTDVDTLKAMERHQVQPADDIGASAVRGNAAAGNKDNSEGKDVEDRLRLAIVRPFCEFDAYPSLPTTFDIWNSLLPCASSPLQGVDVDLFLFYSQTYSEYDHSLLAVDSIMKTFFSEKSTGWPKCFDNIYAIEANIIQELDLYIPSAQEELYNWINGPNRQFEAFYRIIQSEVWGTYDAAYLMEGDSVPHKPNWLDALVGEVAAKEPFAILGSKYMGDKWDRFGPYSGTYSSNQMYDNDKIPVALLNHTNGNAIYNTSHPLLERLVSQLEVEVPSPYTSIPYDLRMYQIWVEGLTGEMPRLAPKILLNEEGNMITLSNNTEMFRRWVNAWKDHSPFKYSKVIANYAATNLLPRHIGEEYISHGAKFYNPWDWPTRSNITLVVSEAEEADMNQTLFLENLKLSNHPFTELVFVSSNTNPKGPTTVSHLPQQEDAEILPLYEYINRHHPRAPLSSERRSMLVSVRTQQRLASVPSFMDLCEVDVATEWFMVTKSDHRVRRQVDLMFTPIHNALEGRPVIPRKPVIPFTPAVWEFCFKDAYCKNTVMLAQKFEPGFDKVINDSDMLFNRDQVRKFCVEWKGRFGVVGERLYENKTQWLDDCVECEDVDVEENGNNIVGPKGPTATSYCAYLGSERENCYTMYRLTDRTLYGARNSFVKLSTRPNGLQGDTTDNIPINNTAEETCSCSNLDNKVSCQREADSCGCSWRLRFESCHDLFTVY